MLQDAVAALAGVIEFEMELRRVFQDDALARARAGALRACVVELGHRLLLLLVGADDADKDVGVLEVGRDVDLLHGDELAR